MNGYEVLPVTPDSPEWYEVRRQGLGASDSAAILGLSKWTTPLDVYRSKLGIERDFDPMLAWIGHNLEPVIGKWIDEFAPEIGRQMPGFAARSLSAPHLFATPDAVTVTGIPIEKKTSMEFMRDDWADGVPLYYQVQSQQQQFVLGAPFGWVVVFHGGRDFQAYKVMRDDSFIDNHLVPKTRDWWEAHVVARVAPEPTTLGELAEVYPSEAGAAVEASEAAVEAAERRAVLLSDIRSMTEEADALQLAIGQYMGSAELLTFEGRDLLTFKSQAGRRSVSVSELEAKHPELAVDLVKQGAPFKVMRMKRESK